MRTRLPIATISSSPSQSPSRKSSSTFTLTSPHLLQVRLTVSIFLLAITSLSSLNSSCATLNPINTSVTIPISVPGVGLRRRSRTISISSSARIDRPSAFVTSGGSSRNKKTKTDSSNYVYRDSVIPSRSRLETKIMTLSSGLYLHEDEHENECEHNQNGDKQSTMVHHFRSPFLPTKLNNLNPPPNGVNGAANGDQNLNGWDHHRHPHMREDEPEDLNILSALIILNSPMERPPSAIFDKLWEISSFRVCADGGANRLYHATVNDNDKDNDHDENSSCSSGSGKINNYIPDLIRGDLDSLEPHVRDYYSTMDIGIGDTDRVRARDKDSTGKGKVRIERDPDQNCNDLDKALKAIRDWFSATQMETQAQAQAHKPPSILTSTSTSTKQSAKSIQINVYGAFGGRFDQEMASIQALYRWKDEFQYNIALYTDETFAILCRPGPHVRNEIRLPFYSNILKEEGKYEREETKGGDGVLLHVESQAEGMVVAECTKRERMGTGEGPTVGLIPIGCICDGVITRGFKWDLDGSIPLEFGGLVSTSNRAEDEVLTVECQQPLVFTAEMTRLKVSKVKVFTERMQGGEAPNNSGKVRDRI